MPEIKYHSILANVQQRFGRGSAEIDGPYDYAHFFLNDTIFTYKSNYDSQSPVNPIDKEQIPKN